MATALDEEVRRRQLGLGQPNPNFPQAQYNAPGAGYPTGAAPAPVVTPPAAPPVASTTTPIPAGGPNPNYPAAGLNVQAPTYPAPGTGAAQPIAAAPAAPVGLGAPTNAAGVPLATGAQPRGQYGDAAAAAANPAVVQAPAGFNPATPSPIATANAQPAGAVAPAAVTANMPTAAAPRDPLDGGAVFGIYPKVSAARSTNANDAALRRGVQATGPSTFVPAAPLNTDLSAGAGRGRVNPALAVPGAVAAAGAAAAAPSQAPGAGSPLPADDTAANDKITPAAPESYQPAGGIVAGLGAPGAAPAVATPNADAVIAASNRLNQGATVIDAGGGDARQKFFDDAALRSAAAKGSWSPRRGFQGDEGAVRAASIPVAQRGQRESEATRAQTATDIAALREGGETTRAAGFQAGANTRAAAQNAIEQGRLGVEQGKLGIAKDVATAEGRTRERIEAAQLELQNAKTPEAIRAAQTKVLALQGKEQTNRFTVVPGGQEIDPATGLARTLPSRVIDNQTGQLVDTGAGAAGGAAKPQIAEGSMSKTADGKPIKFVGGKWVAA